MEATRGTGASPLVSRLHESLQVYAREWAEAGGKGAARLTRLVNAKMELLYGRGRSCCK